MKKFTIRCVDTATGATKTYNYNDEMIASAKFYALVNVSLWNLVELIDNATGEILDFDEIPDFFVGWAL